MHALAENETWDLVDAPKGVKPIGCRWVYKVKHNTNGLVNWYKARLVAYMTRVAEVREPESYAQAAKDANWRAAMEEEMHTLA